MGRRAELSGKRPPVGPSREGENDASGRTGRQSRGGRGGKSHVQILMGVFNGLPHLAGQLDSFAAQRHSDWSLLCGDDGSTDNSAESIRAFARAHPGHRVEIIPGPGRGNAAANFLSLLQHARPGTFVAFSDQDDVWLPRHLRHAVRRIAAKPNDVVVYAARTFLTDADLRGRRPSNWPQRGTWFGNSLVQNVLAGNTIVLSPAAAELLRRTVPAALAAGVPFHDWWTYQVISGAGGRIELNPEPMVLYRQHGHNMMGAHRGLAAGLSRTGMVLKRRYSGWVNANLAALEEVSDLLTPQARRLLTEFSRARSGSRRRCAVTLAELGVRRQSIAGDRTLDTMARLGRL